MASRKPAEVFAITHARRPLSEEQTGRTRRYLISMTIRTVCFLGAIVTPGWPRWVLVAGAVVLPYLAVVAANAGRENEDPPDVDRPTLGGVHELSSPVSPRLGQDPRAGH